MKSKGFLQCVFDMNARICARIDASIQKDLAKIDSIIDSDPKAKSLLSGVSAAWSAGRALRKLIYKAPFAGMKKATAALANKTNSPLNV